MLTLQSQRKLGSFTRNDPRGYYNGTGKRKILTKGNGIYQEAINSLLLYINQEGTEKLYVQQILIMKLKNVTLSGGR